MTRVTSRYKIFGGFGILILLNGLVGIGTCYLLASMDTVDLASNTGTQIAFVAVLGMQLLLLILFATQNRSIIADNNGITFTNPIIPAFRSSYRWTDFEYYVTVEENAEHGTHKAVWLIKDQRLKERFSSYYYANYDELVGQIRTLDKGAKYVEPFDQFLILMGLKGVK